MDGLIGAPKPLSSAVAVGLANFREEVLDVAPDQVIVIDFWAPWCGPCKQLDPILNRVIESFKGAVKLVKINVDQEPQLAAQFRIQSIPTVVIFKNGQPVDGFQGLVSESALQQVIERHVDQSAARDRETLLESATQAFYAQDLGHAAGLYAAILQQDPDHVMARVGYARCLFLGGELEQAEGFMATFTPEQKLLPEVKSLDVWRQLIVEGLACGDLTALKGAAQAAPADLTAQFMLAQGWMAQGALNAALQLLLQILKVQMEAEQGAVKAYLLRCFEALGSSHPLVVQARRDFSKLMFI
ncbi:MAG: thioredoxin [Holosporales bacterium]